MSLHTISSEECIFIILGATGDLTRRKLIPAIYKLVATKKVSKFAIVGVSIIQAAMHEVFESAQQFIADIDYSVWRQLQQNVYYYQMDFHDASAYQGLSSLLKTVESKHQIKHNRLFYLATMPQHFAVITRNLAHSNIVKRHEEGSSRGWARVVYEKPFGYDLASARQINKAIARVFDEQQVFRIDHYLGKELVGNIALARFTNRVFQPLWNNKHIDSVQVIVSETLGVGTRGAFYDSCGALRDVLQNHMMQIVALIAMEAPDRFTAGQLRSEKAKVLSKIKVESGILGQYNGYREERDVAADSTTETFAAVKLAINNRRWKGVPFYLKTGKHLGRYEASIHIKFKMVKCLLNFCPSDSNYLTINIQPHEGLFLELNVKEPRVFDSVVPVTMNFAHSTLCGPNTPEAYEVLLFDVIKGDHFAFVRNDEIEYSWKIIEKIKKMKLPVYSYEQGSFGPVELALLDEKKEIKWRA